LPVPIGSPTHLSEPVGDKKRITSIALIRVIFVLVEEETGGSKGLVGRVPRSMGEGDE
jgi:hypothetical protein